MTEFLSIDKEQLRHARAGSFASGYSGVVRIRGVVLWTCPHSHPKAAEAMACGDAELGRRRVELAE